MPTVRHVDDELPSVSSRLPSQYIIDRIAPRIFERTVGHTANLKPACDRACESVPEFDDDKIRLGCNALGDTGCNACNLRAVSMIVSHIFWRRYVSTDKERRVILSSGIRNDIFIDSTTVQGKFL